MRARTAAAFILGFLSGGLCLGVVAWRYGALENPFAPWRRAAAPTSGNISDLLADIGKQQQIPVSPPVFEPFDFSAQPPEPATSATLPNTPPPALAIPSKPVGPPPAPTGHGEADRMAPDLTGPSHPGHLSMPLSGIDPKKLTDTFKGTRGGHKHEALDIAAPRGTPVLAVAEGNVAKLFNSKDGGLTVYQFDNSKTYGYYYAHLDRYAPGVQEGTLLRTGDVLGYVGSTGNASANAPHLHFAVFKLGPEKRWWDGTAIDPLPLLK